jgi:hypothetical protein
VRRRRSLVLAFLIGATLWASLEPAASQDADADIEATACAVDPVLLQRTWRGYRPDRSGNIQLLTPEPDFIGQGGLPHSGPWDYIADVPLVWYGPGYVAPTGEVDRRVTLADLAPTQAELLGFDFDAPDGSVLDEALLPSAERAEPPRLLVVVVWDGAGDVTLDEWPDAWPVLQRLAAEGTSYTEAEVGSSPPSTAQIHATIGTGAFTRTHGMIGHHFRIGPRLVAPWDLGPRFLGAPTFADLYDRAMDNEPVVGTVAMVDLHLGMMSHGSLWGGGDQDIAVLRQQGKPTAIGEEGVGWVLNPVVEPFYELPDHVNDLPPIATYFDVTDRADGRQDGLWLEEPIDDARTLFGFHTPARIPFQQRVVEEVVRREGFGTDDVPDLLFLNYKLTDEVGHIHTLNSEYMRDAVAAQDEALGQLVALLDQEVGQGRWVVAVTSDHGHTPDPEVSGATAISPGLVAGAVNARFDTDGDDTDVVVFTQPTMMHIDVEELTEQGATLEDVSRFILTLRKGDVASTQWPGPADELDDPAFEAAYPSAMLETLPCVPRD